VHQAFNKKLERGTNKAPAGNPNKNGNIKTSQPFISDDLTL
jgi:hypothetical protein